MAKEQYMYEAWRFGFSVMVLFQMWCNYCGSFHTTEAYVKLPNSILWVFKSILSLTLGQTAKSRDLTVCFAENPPGIGRQ
jgi:hypothetical protein